MIELKNIEVKYDNFVAVKEVDLKVEDGQFFTLLGPSGCGKTTLLRAIAGLEHPSQGQILIDGENITHLPAEKRSIGMVFQSYALFPTMTVYDNIAYGLKIEGMAKKDIQEKVQKVSDLVDLSDEMLAKNVSKLSGGQQQRVAIARTLVKEPDIVLFDEPLSNLDARLRKQLRIEIKRIQRKTNFTAIYVTHDQEEALAVSDQVAVFSIGKIEQVGDPLSIYNHSATEFVCTFLGDVNPLSSNLVEVLNHQEGFDLSAQKNHYIRDERIYIQDDEAEGNRYQDYGYLSGQVEDVIFQGNMIKYICRVEDSLFNIVVRNDRAGIHSEGDRVRLYLDCQDILSYERGQ